MSQASLVIQETPPDAVRLHPRNLRRQVGDVDEMAQSMRERGVQESLEVAAKVRRDFTRDLLQRPGLGGKEAALEVARFTVAAMWEFIAEAYDWGPDELSEFADLIGVQIDQEPTWGQQQAAIGVAIRERRRVDDLAGVLLAMHALRIEPDPSRRGLERGRSRPGGLSDQPGPPAEPGRVRVDGPHRSHASKRSCRSRRRVAERRGQSR